MCVECVDLVFLGDWLVKVSSSILKVKILECDNFGGMRSIKIADRSSIEINVS